MTALLKISDLTLTHKRRILVDNFSLEIPRGERIGLIGESGSGKSLTALAIMGLLPHGISATGSISFENKFEVINANERLLNTFRGKIASIVFQDPLTSLNPLMPIGNQIALALNGRKIPRSEMRDLVLNAIEEVSIQNPSRIAASLPHQISGGERQRIAIAMAIGCKPDLLIADEPTTSLDVTIQAEILELLNSLVARDNTSLLFISHDLAVIRKVVNRAVVLQSGKIVDSGEINELISNPKSQYARELISSAETLDRALDKLQMDSI